jgi:RNA polymerase sigma-70 factor (ECF subfamily)
MGASWAVAKPTRQDPADPELAALRAVADGDDAALQWIYTRHGPGVLSYLRGQLRDPALAEEVLQDVMLAVWRSAGSFRGECKLRTWLLTIAHRRALNARRRKRLPSQDIAATSPAHLPESPPADRGLALRTDLRLQLLELSPEHRASLELFFFHDLSIADIARVLDLPPGTVKSRLHRAKAQLRLGLESLDGLGSTEPDEPKEDASDV